MPLDLSKILTDLLDPKNLIPFITAVTGLIAGIRAWWISRHSAKKDWVNSIEQTLNTQVDWLTKRIEKLQSELDAEIASNELLKSRVKALEQELTAELESNRRLNARVKTLESELENEREEKGRMIDQVACRDRELSWLKQVLAQHGIDIPPMPADWRGE